MPLGVYDIDTLFKKGGEFVKNKQFDEALSIFGAIIVLDPSNEKAWVARGVVLSNQQKYLSAELAFDQALLINPSNQIAINNRNRVNKYLNPPESGIPDSPSRK